MTRSIAFLLSWLVAGFISGLEAKEARRIDEQADPGADHRTSRELLYSEDFSGDWSDWTIVDGGEGGTPYHTWAHSDQLEPHSEYVTFTVVDEHFMFCNSDAAGSGNVTLDERLISPALDLADIQQNLLLSLDVCAIVSGDVCRLELSTTSPDGPWIELVQLDDFAGRLELDLSEFAGEESVWISFLYGDNGTWLYGFAIDNITLETQAGTQLSGTVREEDSSGPPLEGVEISLDGQVLATTGEDGSYSISSVEGSYDLLFFKAGYLPVEHESFQLEGVQQLDEVLLAVSGSVSTSYVALAVGADSLASATIQLENDGTAPLAWSALLSLYEDPVVVELTSDATPGEPLDSFTAVAGQYGVIHTDGGFFTCNATWGDPPGIWSHYTQDGDLVASYTLSTSHHLGYDLCLDPDTDMVYSVISSGDIISFPVTATDGNDIEVIGALPEGFSGWGIALDHHSNQLYITDLMGGSLGMFDLNNGEFTELGSTPFWTRSITYMPADPDGFSLWADSNWDEDGGVQGIYRYNPLTGIWDDTPVFEFDNPAAGGLEATLNHRSGFLDLVYYNQETGQVALLSGLPLAAPWLQLSAESQQGVLPEVGTSVDLMIIADLRHSTLGSQASVTPGSFAGAELELSGDGWVEGAFVDVVVSLFDDVSIHSEEGRPARFRLHHASPNPFNPDTQLRFELPTRSHARMEVFNLRGQRMFTLIDRTLPAGQHVLRLSGRALASGVYFVRLEAGHETAIQKLTLSK